MIKTNFAVLIAERGLKIADVYESTGISKTTLIALAENTGKGVQFDTVDKLCNFLDIELKDFFVYVPYIWDMKFKQNTESEDSDYIIIKLKTNQSEKDYFLSTYFLYPQNYDFPLDDDSFSLWIKIDLEGSDAYSTEDFFQFLGDLPVSMKTTFYNQLLDTLKSNVLIKNKSITTYKETFDNTKDGLENITLNEKSKVYISFFNDYSIKKDKKFESSKIITV